MTIAGGTMLERASEPAGELVRAQSAGSQFPGWSARILRSLLLAQGPHFENRHAVGSWRTEYLTQWGGQEGFTEVGVFQLGLG